MTTYNLLNDLSGNLQSSTEWGQQQALELIQRNVVQAMHTLSAQEQADYLTLLREAQQALADLEAKKAALISAFKTEGMTQLRARLDGRDPEQLHFETDYLQKREQPFPLDPPVRVPESRPRRAYDEWRHTLHTKRVTLWEAACLNFGFTHSVIQDSGYSLVESSRIIGPGKPLDALAFINIARELNLGGQLQVRLQTALAVNGNLRSLFVSATRAMLRFELLESWRTRAATGLAQSMYDTLRNALEPDGPPLDFDTLNLNGAPTPIVAVPFVPWETSIPLPLLVIRVASLGVVSYFPLRPGGAFRYHADAKGANSSLRQQLKTSHQQQDLGWFSRQLPLIGMSVFKPLLTQEPRPEGMSWLASKLYDGFHEVFPERTLDSVRFSADAKTGRTLSLVNTLVGRHIQRYQTDLSSLATTRSEADWKALKDGVAAVAGEILQLLLTPMPGGVTGMNRIMQLAVMGSMTYSLGQGLDAAVKGEAGSFASALSDVADLAISGRLIGVAGRAHRRRMLNYLDSLGNPRKVTRADGVDELWRPHAQPYAHASQHLLDGREADALGLYHVQDRTYAKLHHADQTRVVEVSHDANTMRYVLRHTNGGLYTPPIIFEPALQAWVFDLNNTHTLSDPQLLQRMLPNGSDIIAVADLELMLRSTATTRTTLDAVWSAQPAPLNLIEGVRRMQADQAIRQIAERFNEPGYLPPHADGLVFSLLTQLPNWPADTLLSVRDEQGRVMETYSPSAKLSAKPHSVNLTRQEDGRYADVDNQRLPPGTLDPLLRLIIRQQPATSTLGKDAVITHTEGQRIQAVRQQVATLAGHERTTLFSTVVNYDGYEKTDLVPPAEARRFLPLKASPRLVAPAPLLKKLRDLNRPLAPTTLERLLEQQPLTARQQTAYLQHGTLPVELRDLIDQQRTVLRIDAVIDGLYHPRDYAEDTDQWAREFAAALIRNTLKRPFVITEAGGQTPYISTGPDDLTVELRHYGAGDYRAYDMRNGGEIPVAPVVDSFYLSIGSVLQPHERQLLGMTSASDAKGLRKTLGDYMGAQRSPDRFVSLVDRSLVQYEQQPKLPPDMKPATNGVFEFNTRVYLPLLGALYQIMFDKNLFKWRLVHPKKSGVNTPTLEQNGEGAWRLSSDNPMTWDDHSLLYRLGNQQYLFTQEIAGKIMALTDTSPEALRQVHCTAKPAPPLLADTCKRFKIDHEIQLFIEAMRTDPTAAPARPELQLLVLTAIKGWPADHVLQIVDNEQRVLKQYPDSNLPNVQAVKVTDQAYNSGKLLPTVLEHDKVCEGLLGETPTSDDERLFKLVEKILSFTEQERAKLLNSIYARSERDGSEQVQRLKAKYPSLPASTAKVILGHATSRELKQLHEKNQVGLRLSEQARLSSHDLRLNRAFEGLYLPSCANADSDKIALNLLKSLPDWPKNLRVDIHQDTYQGPLLESAGHLDGTSRRRLARSNRAYQAYDAQGGTLGSASNSLLEALAHLLSDSEKASLGITEQGDVSVWREQIVALALGRRIEIKGWLDLPHLQPWMQPPLHVDRSFLAYPIWGLRWLSGGNGAPDLISRARELYPSLSRREARAVIHSMNLSEPAALIELDRRKAEYDAMDTELRRWAQAPQSDNGPNDLLELQRENRLFTAELLRQAWRRDGRHTYVHDLFLIPSLELRIDHGGLPPALFLAGLTGFAHIEHLALLGSAFPDSADLFLQKFPGLKSLHIRCGMTELPTAITDMTQLISLDLSYNQLVLNEESSARLANMTRLRYLDLSHNRLAIAPNVSRLSELRKLNLRNTRITQWPSGTWQLTQLWSLFLEDNLISSVPEQVFTGPRSMTEGETFLHGNPLSDTARRRIRYAVAPRPINVDAPQATLHNTPESDDINLWLTGVPATDITERSWLWEQLRANEEVRADDVFQVLRDLPETFAYKASTDARQALTTRVWTLLQAMGDSTELRNNVCLNTYGAGTCGDSALLAFTNMELEHRIHQSKSLSRTYESDRALIALSTGRFYLNHLDHISDKFIHARELAGQEVDPAEVTIFFRARLAKEFNLPFYPLELLYTVESYVTPAVLEDARTQLQRLGKSPALQEWLLMEAFWIEYLTKSHPEPFATVKETIEYKVQLLEKQLPSKQSDEYLERRQSLVDLENDEHNRLVRQLTLATQAALRRVSQASE
ncbi:MULTISPECIES: NEL-type E3 ubiquitin ligase domain-containing protein [Pseudomonas]|uniref:NEL-type E3 ubiquitin ligase domain-containing protein n=1 Tax=Pseudomonas TaxID=286 RepID=UPI001AE92B25|nr:NEL-type E3 ubiquitin ligase domain-containing protein [Pseudomonas sp. PvP006]MBP1128010.1 hypothetical protein [Pseudomonas sp. PvP025]MDQ0396948.1 hypothetical protein [Pseudomonas sp. PvP006]